VVVGRVDTGVDDKFRHGKVLVPVGLAVVDIEANVILDFLVGVFCLAIGLRMVHSGETRLDVELLEEVAHELRCKLRTSVAGELEGETIEAKKFLVVDVGNSFRANLGGAGKNVDKLAVVICENNSSIMAIQSSG
jgi:hypothetical protein